MKTRLFFLASAVSYGAGIVHYAWHEKMIVPALGGWLSGLLLMEGFRRSDPRKA